MKIQLVITLDEKGQLNVTGPIQQTVICFGILERAKDVIRKAADQAQPAIVAPTNGDVLTINRGTGHR